MFVRNLAFFICYCVALDCLSVCLSVRVYLFFFSSTLGLFVVGV